MQDVESLFLLDTISILPNNLDLYIQAPSLEDEVVLGLMIETEFGYCKIKLNDINKEVFIKRIKDHPIIAYFNRIEIRQNDKLLFEGYDGVEYGILSQNIEVPNWFKDKYFKIDVCGIANEW